MKELSVDLEGHRTALSLRAPADLAAPPEGCPPERALWVSDKAVWAALAGPAADPAVRRALAPLVHPDDRAGLAAGGPAAPRPADNVVLMEPGEDNKTWDQVAAVLNAGFARGLARDGYIVGLGGGVVCDMAAFAASLYMRGCRLCLVPTTLLAQVDASLGGKTGINFGGYKNMVGSFYPADQLRIIPELNASLPEREYLSGLGEVVKHAFLADPALLELLETRRDAVLARSPELLPRLVWDSLLVKAGVVERDFKERGERAHLNLGHTFAHGLESAAGFGAWSHGEAVAWGMAKAARLSQRLGLCGADYAERVVGLLRAYGYRCSAPDVPADAIIKAMLMDKKKQGGAVRFVLQRGPQDTTMQAVGEADLRAVLALRD